jgi:hypothetical protein
LPFITIGFAMGWIRCRELIMERFRRAGRKVKG